MDQTVFRIPNTIAHIESNGMWVPGDEPHENVVELTTDLAHSLAPAYVGNIINTTSTRDASPDDTEPDIVDTLIKCSDLIELPFKTAEIIQKLNAWFNGPGPDPVAQALARIDTTLGRIEDTQLAAWKTARGDNLAFLRAHSSSALQTAKGFLEADRPRNDLVWASRIAIAERDSLLAVDTFTADLLGGFWLRPDSIKAISWAGDPNEWMQYIPDRAGTVAQGQAWDHRWALPATTYAIAARIAVLKAFDSGTPGEASQRCEEAKAYAGFLNSVFNQMYAGVRQSRLRPEQYPSFSQGRMPAAAVDLNGGYFVSRVIIMGHTHDYGLPPVLYPSGLRQGYDFESLVANVNLFNSYWYNQICVKIGLPDLLTLISRLQDECATHQNALSSALQQFHPILVAGRTHPGALETAAVARTLARVGEPPDSADDPSRMFEIYAALRDGGEEAQNLTATYTSQLSRIGSRVAVGAPPG